MMNSLFSIFDPCTSFKYSMNWLSSMMMILFMPLNYWLIPSRSGLFFLIFIQLLLKEFKVLLFNKVNLMNMIMFVSLFFFILLNNFMGMFPYIFTFSSHLVFSFSLALVLWLSYMMFGWIFNSIHMFSHLVPSGTPVALMSFMVLVETLSNLIRSGTLSVRLCANMIAGHLLMTLISSLGEKLMLINSMLLILLQGLLIILELSVSLIQAFVFSVLSMLYCAEVN